MRGKFLHNQVMVAALVSALRLRGYHAHLEHPVRRGKNPPAVDMFFNANGKSVAMEIERTTERIANDVKKAQTLRADFLLLVMPCASNVRSAESVVRALRADVARQTPRILVMTLGAALQWVANNCPMMSADNVRNDI
jgi:hypothetical protein